MRPAKPSIEVPDARIVRARGGVSSKYLPAVSTKSFKFSAFLHHCLQRLTNPEVFGPKGYRFPKIRGKENLNQTSELRAAAQLVFEVA
jgi:hypothetical protein